MMLAILAESALRSFLLGGVVWLGLNLLRVRNPNVHMTAWVMVLLASLSMPLLMHWTTVTITVHASPVPAPEHLWPAETAMPERLGASILAGARHCRRAPKRRHTPRELAGRSRPCSMRPSPACCC